MNLAPRFLTDLQVYFSALITQVCLTESFGNCVKALKVLVKCVGGEQQEHIILRFSQHHTPRRSHAPLFQHSDSHTFGIRLLGPTLFHSSFPFLCWPSFSPVHSTSSLFLRDVLPFTLKLPEAIASARTSADLEEVAKLGAGLFPRFSLNIYLGDKHAIGAICGGEIWSFLTPLQQKTTAYRKKTFK